MIPQNKQLLIAAGLVLLALATDLLELPDEILTTVTIGYLLTIVIDGLRLLLTPVITVQRQLDANLPVKEWNHAQLTLGVNGKSPQQFLLHEMHDQVFECPDFPLTVSLQANQECQLNYRLRARERGTFNFNGIQYRLFSPWGLWSRKRNINLAQTVQVQPNYQSVVNLALQGEEQAVARMGLRLQRRRGEGTEFHQLREYRSGDAIRKIDWKATARAQKLISKEFRDEQDQQLIFLLDSGRRMRHKEGDSVFIDDTINAMLLVSYIAAQQGDSVGFLAFGNSNHWCPPKKHRSIVKHLVDHCFDIQAGLQHSDYLQAAQRLLELQKKRALVVILTNTRDEDSDDLEKAVVLLRQRHLVTIADLQESFFQDIVQQDIDSIDDGLTYLATQDYLQNRKQMQRSLSSLGSVYLDCQASELAAKLVGTYQQIKSSGRL